LTDEGLFLFRRAPIVQVGLYLQLFLLLLIGLPILRMVLATDLEVLRSSIEDAKVISSILLTLRAALWATLVCAFMGIPMAYLLARHNFFGKGLVEGLINLPVMIPHNAAGIALLMVYGPRFFIGKLFRDLGISFVGTEWGISLAMAYVSLPFLVNAARDGFLSLDPRLEKVARTLGASAWSAFFRITLPLAWRYILTGKIMMWARGISEFGAVIILTYHPIIAPILIYERLENYGLKYAYPVAVLLILLCLIIFGLLRLLASSERRRDLS